MRKTRFTEEQIVQVLHEWNAGAKMAELIRRHGVTEKTLYRWNKKYGGLQGTEEKRLKALEEENPQLKRLVADRALKAVLLEQHRLSMPSVLSGSDSPTQVLNSRTVAYSIFESGFGSFAVSMFEEEPLSARSLKSARAG